MLHCQVPFKLLVAPEDGHDELNLLKMNRRDINAKDANANMDVQDNFALLRGGAVGGTSACVIGAQR